MKKKKVIKIIAICVAVAIILSIFIKDEKETEFPVLNSVFAEQNYVLNFASQPSQTIKLSNESATKMHEIIEQIEVGYQYADLYDLPEVEKRLDFDSSVNEHQSTLLNNETLNAEYLSQLVVKNNEKYKPEMSFKFEDVEQEFIDEICKLIVRVVDIMQEQYPNIDWNRVYCNLSNLKILYEPGMLAYAKVKEDLVLSVSKSNISIAQLKLGDNGYRDVLVHEIIHIIQLGCLCEHIENCGRRAGISVYWDDFSLNTADWTWLVEGAAERFTCNVTGDDAVSYQYKVDYVCSYNLSIFLRDDVASDTIEKLTFYDNPELLFEAFGCRSQHQRDEVLKMMISTEILQTQPEKFYELCKEKTGYNPGESQQEKDEFGYYLKADICISLAKEFYENLVDFLCNNKVTCNDLLFLINLFEGHLNQHLKYNKENLKMFNEDFIKQYNIMRDKLFEMLSNDNPKMNFVILYNEYSIFDDNKEKLNADLTMLPESKRDFLIERAQWQKDNLSLGEKVPMI